MNSDWPTNEPMLTNLLIRKLVKEQRERPELEHAFDTLLRHSDAAGCARKLGLKMAGYQAGEPMDASGVWVTFLGSLIHEQVQAAILEAYPDAEIEAKVRWDDLSASGHCDALIRLPSGWTVMYELKTKGGFGWDKAVGLDRKGYKLRDHAEGPPVAAKIQGALNALAAGADELRIGIISMEAVSKMLAERVNWSDERRFLAEWVYPRSVFEPWAQAERTRFALIVATHKQGRLPGRVAIGDKFETVELNPDAQRPAWQCTYCGFRDLCSQAGPGTPRLPIPGVPVPPTKEPA